MVPCYIAITISGLAKVGFLMTRVDLANNNSCATADELTGSGEIYFLHNRPHQKCFNAFFGRNLTVSFQIAQNLKVKRVVKNINEEKLLKKIKEIFS